MIPTEAIDLMLAKRVQRLRIGDLEIELHPSAFAPPAGDPMPKTPLLPEATCRCGHHPVHQHNEHGECFLGCDPERCAPVEGV